jgi:hypothetical protein
MEKYVLRKAFDVAPQGERVSCSTIPLIQYHHGRITDWSLLLLYSLIFLMRFSGVKRNNSRMVSCFSRLAL